MRAALNEPPPDTLPSAEGGKETRALRFFVAEPDSKVGAMTRNPITRTISSKGQTTLPVKVRKALGVQSGDVILYEIGDEQVRIRKAQPLDLSWARALESTLGEWNDPHDDDL